MSDTPKQNDWTKPAAMAIPEGGFLKDRVEQGRYGPIFPKTPACYGFSILAKIKPGTKQNFYDYANGIEKAVADTPDCLAVLKLHYLRWVLFDVKGDTYFMYQGIFDTDFDKYTEDAVAIFTRTGLRTVFENLEGFPEDYARTLGYWIDSYEARYDEAVRLAGIERARVWRLYLRAARAGFTTGWASVYQVLARKPD